MFKLSSGFITQNNGDEKSQLLKVGQLTKLLSNQLGENLKLNLLSGHPEFNGIQMDNYFVENFYIPLSEWGYEIRKTAATDAIMYAASKNSYHPVVEDLERIENDELIQPIELEKVATNYLKTNDDLYDAMLSTWLIGAVARAFEHGCKMDNCLVLQGKEGIRKSTFFKALAGNKDWFCDTWQRQEQKLYMAIGQCWIYELAELDHMTSKDHQGKLKGIFTSDSDTYPKPYARAMGKYPRPSVFAASSNRFDFLRDPSADHRRYWIIPLTLNPHNQEYIDVEKVEADRDAILKAAIIEYRKGTKPCLPQKLQTDSENRNKGFLSEHPFMDGLADWVLGQNVFTTGNALIGAGLREKGKISDYDLKQASECLQALGYEKDKHQTSGAAGKKRYWRKPEEA